MDLFHPFEPFLEPAKKVVPESADSDKKIPDFSKDEDLLEHVNRSRYIILDVGGFRILRCNWVVTALASIVLWSLVIYSIEQETEAQEEFGKWQSWVTQNFTWLYISTQNAWIVFLVWLGMSKYGNIKLGRDDEKPKYDDLSWFAMLFACGIGIGLYYYGVTEPMYYYNGYPNLQKPGWTNDDQRAQQALFITIFHWGLHGWAPYITVALCLGLVCFRQGRPLSIRYCFLPLVGEKVVLGTVGDIIDALSIACTTFGVCTSLGLGVTSVLTGMERLEIGDADPESETHKILVVLVITTVATLSVLSGIDNGIKGLSNMTFGLGNLLLLMCLFFDNTWYLLNVLVQTTGHYLQYFIQIGSETDAFQQLNYELDATKTNLLMGSAGPSSLLNRLKEEDLSMATNPTAFYSQSPTQFMDWWTIFYWGWWISWAPFVGLFIAMISRGRTIRNVIFGAFIVPTLFVLVWFSTFGGLGIKMQRIAELVLVGKDDVYNSASPDCDILGYAGGEPVSVEAIALAKTGYYALACRPYTGHIFDVMEPYTGFTTFLQYLVLIGVFFYFITSSDSGSFVDDLISANGHTNPPAVQKVYWCWTEGLTAIALIRAGGADSISALRSVSIVAGLPYTFIICFMCTAIYRCVKIEMGELDIINATPWKTDVFDVFSAFDGESALGKAARVKSLGVAVLMPFVGLTNALTTLCDTKIFAVISALAISILWYAWFILIFTGYVGGATEDGKSAADSFMWLNVASLGWVLYVAFAIFVGAVRTSVRQAKGIYGSMLEDLFTTLCMPFFVVSQLAYEGGADEEQAAEEVQTSL